MITDPRAKHNMEAKANYNLIGTIVERAVKDFNYGTQSERADAAAFFRSEDDFGWMLDLVEGNMDKFIAAKLDGDPFDIANLKKRKIQNPVRLKNISKPILWRGVELTTAEWADRLGVTYKTMRARLVRYGRCDYAFRSNKDN
jgi:hypothetical protein